MPKFCDISNITTKTNKNTIIQGKVIAKSDLLLTRYKTPYFWCIIKDKYENQQKETNKAKEPNEIKIMFWEPFGQQLFTKIIKSRIYDFKGLKIKNSNKQYHKHSHQLAWTKNSEFKEKEHLNVVKKGFLCNQKLKKSNSLTQINIKHFFKQS